jgi:hypothetical protein
MKMWIICYLATLGDSIGFLVFVRAHAEMLVCFPCSLLAAQQNGVGSRWCTKSKLVKSQDLASGIEDALFSRTGETESSDSEFGDL